MSLAQHPAPGQGSALHLLEVTCFPGMGVAEAPPHGVCGGKLLCVLSGQHEQNLPSVWSPHTCAVGMSSPLLCVPTPQFPWAPSHSHQVWFS